MQGLTVPKGVVHRTRAPERTAILMVERSSVKPTGD
jgi:mannose-6-phosphate isomerase-like protein (cupin superfamily)